MAVAGLEPHPLMQGINQLPELLAPNQDLRAGVLIDHRVERGLYVNSWITKSHRLSVHSILAENRDELELYDFDADPDEFNNVANSSSHSRISNRLMAELLRYRMKILSPWQKRTCFA